MTSTQPCGKSLKYSYIEKEFLRTQLLIVAIVDYLKQDSIITSPGRTSSCS